MVSVPKPPVLAVAGRDRREAVGRVVDIGGVEPPVAVGVPGMAFATPPASTTCPVLVPPITAASLAPLIVTVTTCAVPSAVVTVKLSVSVAPTLSACTVGIALSSV